MIACALLGKALKKPREGLLAFCGVFIHDLARRTDGAEPEHGPNAAKYFFGRFQRLWDKYGLTPEECEQVRQAVSQHSTRELLRPSDAGYAVMAILKDADALDRCRLHRGGLNPDWLRYRESKRLIDFMKQICVKTRTVNKGLPLICITQMWFVPTWIRLPHLIFL